MRARRPVRSPVEDGGAGRRRRLRRAGIGALAALIVAGVAIGVTQAPDGSPAPAVSASAGRGEGTPVSLSGTDPITGKRVDLAAFAGKPVVINIWASWCPGCNDEATDLARLAEAHPEAQVLGIDTQDSEGGARDFYRRWQWQHPSISDPDGAISARFGLQGLPTSIFLNSRHEIVARLTGAGDLAAFEEGLRAARGS